MTVAIRWSRRARRDLLATADFIARDKPAAAAAWTGSMLEAVERAAVFPRSGRIVPEVNRADIRELVLGTYRVVYILTRSTIIVLTIFESHRLIDESALDPTDRP